MKRFALWGGMAIAVLILILSITNASWLAPDPKGAPKQIAHRALAPELIGTTGDRNAECASPMVAPPVHDHLPNTKASILRADRMGGWLIEVDAMVTADGIAVLHSESDLSCLTDGKGALNGTSLEQLQTLDAGYGYSVAEVASEAGKTPFRGKAAVIPTLEEILTAIPPRGRLMVHLASDDPALIDAVAAAYRAAGRDPEERGDAFYGDAAAIGRIREVYAGIWAFNPDAARQCTADYTVSGWTGMLPSSCRGRTMLISLDDQTLLWGWPNRLIARMEAYDGEILIEGPVSKASGPVHGITLPEQLTEIPSSFNGYVWTDDAFTTLPPLIPRFDNRTQEEIDAAQAALERRRKDQRVDQ
ncbi:glycerophosphodiester phosphodiesterase family protein [Erythrobacter ani]|uniref:GP-PDE domain-containing protein n=1 Tax=Erythrobacter ani TaxID=2827235 RepID=A0ABS6SLD7_9SPHN|nr:glycerophosphodiester phosphodiesterase family protein [Erythrobacter ani]MBV7265671.1 hypothetical protein [Erythrobacter ani]